MNNINATISAIKLAAMRVQEDGKAIKRVAYVRCDTLDEISVLATEIRRLVTDVETATADLKRLCDELSPASKTAQKKQRGDAQ